MRASNPRIARRVNEEGAAMYDDPEADIAAKEDDQQAYHDWLCGEQERSECWDGCEDPHCPYTH